MKTIMILIYWVLFSLLFSFNHSVDAQNRKVTSEEAEYASRRWLATHYPNYNVFQVTQNVLTNQGDQPLLYEVITDSITLLLSGNKNAIPILGIIPSSTGGIIDGYENNSLPCGLMSLMDDYVSQMRLLYMNNVDNVFSIDDEWNLLLSRESIGETLRITEVGPLLKTIWGQDVSNDNNDQHAYNYHLNASPDSSCTHYLAGCVAVAMGQVMYYWQTPLLLKGLLEQFDWCNMTPTLDTNTPTYTTNRHAIAYLLTKVGKSVDMDYGCTGSSASTSDARDVLVDKYHYSEEATYSERRHYSDAEWTTKLKNHIDWGFPVIYRGHGSGGHSFVCDGYNSDGKFHFNWGWADNNLNGYYSINQLNPGLHYYDNRTHAAIFYIHPAEETFLCDITLDLGDFYNNNALISHMLFRPYEIIPKTMTNLISASVSTSSSWRTIPDGATATYQAHEEVHLRDGFTVERGADFTARIVPCPNCEENRGSGNPETASAPSNTVPSETTSGYRLPTTGYQPPTTDLYPNPTSGEVTVGVDGEVQAIIIYTPMGLPVGGWRLLSIAPDRVTLDLSPLPAGTYILHIQTPMGVSTKRLVVAR